MVSRNKSSNSDGSAESNIKPVWWDLCAGPHLESTGLVDPKAVELQTIAGAYWRGDEKLPMLQVGSTASLVPDRHLAALIDCFFIAFVN